MGYSKCRSCKRQLSDPRSRERGFGPVCWGKAVSGEGASQEGTNIVLVADDGSRPGDVFFRRMLDGNVETNVAPASIRHSPTGYGWGYSGSGPADLALNILIRFTSEDNAWRLHQEFKETFISIAPPEGLTICGNVIRHWVRERTGPRIAK